MLTWLARSKKVGNGEWATGYLEFQRLVWDQELLYKYEVLGGMDLFGGLFIR